MGMKLRSVVGLKVNGYGVEICFWSRWVERFDGYGVEICFWAGWVERFDGYGVDIA